MFVDECGTHTWLVPLYGYSPKGERLSLSVPRNRGKNTTLLASITLEGMGPSLAVEGSTTARIFEAYLEQVLLPQLEEGQVLVMDNLPAHKPRRVRELIEERGCVLVYLPGYSPEYDPIEEAFSKIKEILLRRAAEPGPARPWGRGTGPGTVRGQPRRCPRVFRACRLLFGRPTTMKRAVETTSRRSSRAGGGSSTTS